jgi:hypothetical protein
MRGIIIFIIGISAISAAFPDVIYDEQTYNYEDIWDAISIYGELDYETADDFETTENWTLELVKVWLHLFGGPYSTNIRVDVFEDTGNGPGKALFGEEVPADDIMWTDTGDTWDPPTYEVDIPITGFDIAAGTRYWVGLQTTGGSSQVYWLIMINEPDWWSNYYFYDGSTWNDSEDYFGYAGACCFELHGSPGGSGVNARSFGAIKALYR